MFESSLNEIDVEVGKILASILNVVAFPSLNRDVIDSEDVPETTFHYNKNVVFTNTQDQIEIFDEYMLKSKKNDVLFPILAYTPSSEILNPDHSIGAKADAPFISLTDSSTGRLSSTSKAKGIETSYQVSLWFDNFKELRYYQNNIILNCIDKSLFYEYKSKILRDNTVYLTSLINLPTINTLPSETEKQKGHGFIYSLGFTFQVWGILYDPFEDTKLIEQVNVNIHPRIESIKNTEGVIQITLNEYNINKNKEKI